MATKQKYLVYRIPENLRKAIKTKKAQNGLKIAELLNCAITESLPQVYEALKAVGFTKSRSKTRPIRWPAEELEALKTVSRQVGIPSSKLLLATLTLFTGGAK